MANESSVENSSGDSHIVTGSTDVFRLKEETTDEKAIYETPLFALLFAQYCPRRLLHGFYRRRSKLANYLHNEPGSSLLRQRSRFQVFMALMIPVVVILQLILQRNSIRGSGGSGSLWLFLSFFFACRNSALTVLFKLPYGQHLQYHKIASNLAIVLGLVHGLMAVYGPLALHCLGDYLYDGGKALFLVPGLSTRGLAHWRKQKGDAYVMVPEGEQLTVEKEAAGVLDLSLYWSGSCLLACMLLLWIFSREFIRRKYFNFFLRSHWVMFLAVICFGIIHSALGFGLICMTVLDIVFRFTWFPKGTKGQGCCRLRQVTPVENYRQALRSAASTRQSYSWTSPLELQGGSDSTVVELRWTDFTGQYLPGQFYFVCIPEVSRFEWHPLSVASTCGQGDMRMIVKAVGSDSSWTSKLAKLAGAESDESDGGRPIDCHLEGPYGVLAVEVEEYSSACFFSGGHGVAPMMSVAGSVLSNRSVETVTFIWSVRNLQLVENCVETGSEIEQRLLLSSGEEVPETGSPHDFRIYATGEADRQTDSRFPVYARGQRPNPLEILEGIAEKVKNAGKSEETKCAVLACGPTSMLRDVRKACEVMNRRKGCLFHLHEETFEF